MNLKRQKKSNYSNNKLHLNDKKIMESITIFGLRAILEAINAEKPLDKVWLLKGHKSPLFESLLHELRIQNIAHSFVPEERLQRFSAKNHQGAVARIAPIATVQIEPLLENVLEKEKNPIFILLDGVTDARNFGAIIRTAAATGVSGIIISNTGSAPINGDVVKTSAGGIFKVPIAKVSHLKDAIYLMQAHDMKIMGISEKAEKDVFEKNMKGPIAVVMGAEDQGISKGVLKIIDEKAKLPMTNDIASLNVSVACAVILYERVRQIQN